MKIPLVCEPWINLRLQKSLATWGDNGKGLFIISKEIATDAQRRYGLPVDADNVYHRAKRLRNKLKDKKNPNQKIYWQAAEEKLSSVLDYMMANCVDPSKIDESTKRDLLIHIKTLKVFEADLLQGGHDGL